MLVFIYALVWDKICFWRRQISVVEFPSTKGRCQINWYTIFNGILLHWYKSRTPSFGPCATFVGPNDQKSMAFPAGQAEPAKVNWVWIGWVFFIYRVDKRCDGQRAKRTTGQTGGQMNDWTENRVQLHRFHCLLSKRAPAVKWYFPPCCVANVDAWNRQVLDSRQGQRSLVSICGGRHNQQIAGLTQN